MLLVLFLLLAACALSETGADAQADSDHLSAEDANLRERAREDMSVISVFDGGCVTFSEVYAEYSKLQELYDALVDQADASMAAAAAVEAQKSIAVELTCNKITDIYLAENSITLLSGADLEETARKAEEAYSLMYQEVRAYFLAEGCTEAQADTLTPEFLAEAGLGRQDYLDSFVEAARHAALVRLLAGEISISEDELIHEYALRLAADTEYYSEYPQEYPLDVLNGFSAYVPAGCRRVRMLYIPAQPRLPSTAENETDAPKEDPDFCREALARAADVYDLLRSGHSFDELYSEYSPARSAETAVFADGFILTYGCGLFDAEVISSVMSLEKPGDYTQPLIVFDSGAAIFEYSADAAEGPVPFEEIRAYLYAALYDQKLNDAYESALNTLMEAANVEYFFERLG
ncbi:MAG: hypothetical protein IKR85_06475 [Clostridia bacterium]|nr:hypothetical protein [Clostridia bacterium]